MLQEVMTKPGEIIFKDVPVPKIKKNEVLIKMMKIGVCGSDIHVYHGKHPFTKYPVTQGHEVSGEIVKVGSLVKKLKIGDKVTIEPQVFCGKCFPCTHGKYNLCENLKVMGFQTTGAASEYFAIDEKKVDKLAKGMSFEEGAMIEPLAVTVHAAKKYGKIKGATCCIQGAGPIGILLCQTLKAMGAKKIMVCDISDYRLSIAKKMGANFVVNTKNNDFNKMLIKCFGKDKCDVIYDCAGNDITMNNAIRFARKGSKIVLVAVYDKMANVDLAVLNDHELDLDTTMMYRHEDYVDAIKFVGNKKIKLKPLITKTFPFKNYLDAYKYIDENREKTMKVIINVQ